MAIALANKYRPSTFSEVMGQTSIIKILKNQVDTQSFKQGYLFCGGAGTGKTTIARIFSREINGVDIKSANRAEIIEIDAASNNGVDNVRELRESVKFKPLQGQYKVYIIDEVHMLSTGAFNALLKTLEEPPAHAVFILCTTDPQKIPGTILSRVQRFDFMRMTTEQTFTQLKKIVDYENEEIEQGVSPEGIYRVSDEVFSYIAKLADGGMRNAISILDTCVNYKEELEIEDMFEILGATDHQNFIKMGNFMLDEDKKGILDLIENIHIDGKDLKQFVKGMLEFVVDLRKLQLLEDFNFVSAPPIYEDSMWTLVEDIEDVKDADLMDVWYKKLAELSNMIKYETNPKTLIQGWMMTI